MGLFRPLRGGGWWGGFPPPRGHRGLNAGVLFPCVPPHCQQVHSVRLIATFLAQLDPKADVYEIAELKSSIAAWLATHVIPDVNLNNTDFGPGLETVRACRLTGGDRADQQENGTDRWGKAIRNRADP
jgi:hypothetical protein